MSYLRLASTVIVSCFICACAETAPVVPKADPAATMQLMVPVWPVDSPATAPTATPRTVAPKDPPPDADAWRRVCDEAQDIRLKNCKQITDVSDRAYCNGDAHGKHTMCLCEHGGECPTSPSK